MNHVYLVYIEYVDGHRTVVAVCKTKERAEAIARHWRTQEQITDAFTALHPIDETIGAQGLEL